MSWKKITLEVMVRENTREVEIRGRMTGSSPDDLGKLSAEAGMAVCQTLPAIFRDAHVKALATRALVELAQDAARHANGDVLEKLRQRGQSLD